MTLRVILLSFGVFIVAAEPNDIHKCGHIFHKGFSCCKNNPLPVPKSSTGPPDDIKECFHIPHKPPSCDLPICIAKKKGYASDDGTIDKEAFGKLIETDFASYPDLIESIKTNCIDGDLSKYGEDDMCDLMKLQHCIDISLIMNCGDWNDQGDCKGIKDLALECTKV